MSAIDGVRIEFPTPNKVGKELVFETPTASVTTRHEPSVVAAGSNLIGLVSEWTDFGAAIQNDGLRQQARVDTGGGLHAISVQVESYEQSPERWGANDGSVWDAGGEPALTQLSVLDNALRSITVDSRGSAITLEVGEYHSGGRFDPLQVAPLQPTLSFDVQERVSSFPSELEFVEITDLESATDALLQRDE